MYRHQPYAPSLIVPASPSEAAFVCCHQRSPKSGTCSFATSSPAPSVVEAALPTALSAYPTFLVAAAQPAPLLSHTPTPAPVSTPAPTPLAHPAHTAVWVAFKYGRKAFMTIEPVCIGETVVVEGDRGIDLGLVDCACTAPQPSAVPSIMRCATAEDTAQHHSRTAKEREALQTMRTLAAQVHCPAHVEDAMFQLDGKKITVIISRTTRSFVDFRRLQRALFDVYRCRIWFAYLDEIMETMSTDVSQPLRRGQRRCSSFTEASNKKVRAAAAAM